MVHAVIQILQCGDMDVHTAVTRTCTQHGDMDMGTECGDPYVVVIVVQCTTHHSDWKLREKRFHKFIFSRCPKHFVVFNKF